MSMPTNNSKLLEKVLSKWEKLDKEYSVIDTSDCSNLGDEDENSECDESLCNKHRQMYRDAVATMIISEARADQLRIDTYNRVQSLKQARAGARSSAIAYMRVGRSKMCLKDRAILLNEINLLEAELKELED